MMRQKIQVICYHQLITAKNQKTGQTDNQTDQQSDNTENDLAVQDLEASGNSQESGQKTDTDNKAVQP